MTALRSRVSSQLTIMGSSGKSGAMVMPLAAAADSTARTFAASGTVVLGGGSVVAQVWGYLGEVIFNMLVLVGLVKGADRVVREMFGM